jgi:cytochrome bd-type quinol oxidase subunit 1
VIPPALTVPTPDWPVVGDQLPIALLFTAHIAVAEFSLGVITLAPIFEAWGAGGGGERALRLARQLARAYYLLFSLGATLGVFAVTALIGLWGNQIGTLVNRFLPLIAVAFGTFLVLTPLLILYENSFDRMPRRRHLLLGVAVALLQTFFMVCIVAIDSYMITPRHAGLLGGALNPVYWDLLLHRLVGNVSWAALFVAAYAVLRLRRAADEGERAYRAWSAGVLLRIGTATLVLMPVLGFLIMLTLRDNARGFLDNLVRGDAAWLFVIQSVLLGVLFVGANLALALETRQHRARMDATGRLAIAVAAGGAVVGVLPAQVLTDSVYGLRYLGLLATVLATLAHLVVRTLPRRPASIRAPASGADAALPFAGSTARAAVGVVGVVAAVLSLYMGFMKEQARGPYAIYGEMTLQDAHGVYNPGNTYP